MSAPSTSLVRRCAPYAPLLLPLVSAAGVPVAFTLFWRFLFFVAGVDLGEFGRTLGPGLGLVVGFFLTIPAGIAAEDALTRLRRGGAR